MKPPDGSFAKASQYAGAALIPSGKEYIIAGRAKSSGALAPGVTVCEFASQRCGARGMSTGTATFKPGAELPYHKHDVSEAATVLQGEAVVSIEGRTYTLGAFDCIHCPVGLAHRVVNPSKTRTLMIHTAFASPTPLREFTSDNFLSQDRSTGFPGREDPEDLVRIAKAPVYRLAEHTRFYDLFAGRFGAVGICGGYGEFESGSSLPCHFHEYDESITIVKGEATCEVMGRRYRLSGYGTAVVPRGLPHRFLNLSEKVMAMIWVYAGSEPTRTLVNARYCAGKWRWKGQVR